MFKRVALILCLGLLASFSFAGKTIYEQTQSITITGVGSGDDSTATDSFSVFNTMHYGNRYWLTVKFDSVEKHEPSGFGLRDTIIVVVKAEYAGQQITLDSTLDSLFDDNELTLDFTSGVGDSIYNFGEHLWVWVRIADTVGATTDSAHVFNFHISGLHLYQD